MPLESHKLLKYLVEKHNFSYTFLTNKSKFNVPFNVLSVIANSNKCVFVDSLISNSPFIKSRKHFTISELGPLSLSVKNFCDKLFL